MKEKNACVFKVPVNLIEEDVLRRQEIRNSTGVSQVARSITQDLLSKKNDYLDPAIAYEIYPVIEATAEYLQFQNGRRINGPAVASILKPAKEIAVVLGTIGPRLEKLVDEYFKTHNSLKGFLLDGIGSAAVDSLAREACSLIKSRAASRGYTASSPYSPGMHGWDIKELPNLLRLVPAAKIGVSLTSGGMIYPRKSIAMVIGIGQNMPQRNQAEACEYCNLRETCRQRYSADSGLK